MYSPHGSDERELFHAPPAIRAAWGEFAAAAQSYEALVTARGVVVDFTGRGVQDDCGLFAQIRNTEQVWPEIVTSQLLIALIEIPR